MKIHDLKPRAGFAQAPKRPRRPRHRRQGRQDRGPRLQGPGRARHGPGPVRGWPDAAAPPHAEGEGLQQPVPRRVPRREPSTLDGFDAGAEVSPTRCGRGGLVAKQGLVKVLARGELTKPLTVKAHGFSAAAVRAIEAAGGTARCCRSVGDRPPARARERPRQPLGYTASVPVSSEVGRPDEVPVMSGLSRLKNMFRVADLRNKILFTLFIIFIFRLGSHIPVPYVDFKAIKELQRSAKSAGGVVGFLDLFSGGALTACRCSSSGSCRTSRRRSSCSCSAS